MWQVVTSFQVEATWSYLLRDSGEQGLLFYHHRDCPSQLTKITIVIMCICSHKCILRHQLRDLLKRVTIVRVKITAVNKPIANWKRQPLQCYSSQRNAINSTDLTGLCRLSVFSIKVENVHQWAIIQTIKWLVDSTTLTSRAWRTLQ